MNLKISGLLINVFCILSAVANIGWGQEATPETKCGCTEYPFKPQPPCHDQCVVRYLSLAELNEIKANLDLQSELLSEILNFQSTVSVNDDALSVKTFKEQFDIEDQSIIREALDNADQQWLDQSLTQKFGFY